MLLHALSMFSFWTMHSLSDWRPFQRVAVKRHFIHKSEAFLSPWSLQISVADPIVRLDSKLRPFVKVQVDVIGLYGTAILIEMANNENVSPSVVEDLSEYLVYYLEVDFSPMHPPRCNTGSH